VEIFFFKNKMAKQIPKKNPIKALFSILNLFCNLTQKKMPERRRKKTLATHPRKALPKNGSKLKTGDKVSSELVVGPTTPCLNVKIDYLVPMNSYPLSSCYCYAPWWLPLKAIIIRVIRAFVTFSIGKV